MEGSLKEKVESLSKKLDEKITKITDGLQCAFKKSNEFIYKSLSNLDRKLENLDSEVNKNFILKLDKFEDLTVDSIDETEKSTGGALDNSSDNIITAQESLQSQPQYWSLW